MSTDRHRLTARLEHSNKSWVVDLIHHKNKLSISRGWAKFVEDNTLQEGDVCSFELTRRDDYVFNVAFRKGNGTANNAILSLSALLYIRRLKSSFLD